MNISLKTNCFDFQMNVPDHCVDTHIDESLPYSAANATNPYDEAGKIHNEALLYFRKNRSKVGKDQSKYLDLYAEFIKARGIHTLSLQTLPALDYTKLKESMRRIGLFDGVIPICFPNPDFPGIPLPWPDGWPGGFLKPGNPAWLIYLVFKMLHEGKTPIFLRKHIVDWETEVMNSAATEVEKAKDLIAASVIRHSIGFWHEHEGTVAEAKKGGFPWAVIADAVGSLMGLVGSPIAGIATAAVASGVFDGLADRKK